MKKIVLALITILLVMPFVVKAKENSNEEGEIVAQAVKYYKTVTFKDSVCNAGLNNLCNNSVTYEVSKEEFDNSPEGPARSDGLVETTYKRLTSTIEAYYSYYNYKANLYWKQIPSTRSYDIMGIGFYGSVKLLTNNINFEQNYTKNGTDYVSYTSYPQYFTYGAGCSFALPTGTLTYLTQDLDFLVQKNTNATIITQLNAADYAHATSTISLNNSKKYTVDTLGITHNGNSSYYDAIDTADAYWYGTW